MDEIKKTRNFTFEELKKLSALEGKKIADVIYHKWINKADPSQAYEFIDKLQIGFSDGSNIVLTAGEESDGLRILEEYNVTKDILMLEEQFEGKITIRSFRANKSEHFKDVMELPISSVQLSKDGDQYLADAIVFEFDKGSGPLERRLVALSPEEGIIVDYFED
jgi:hypothetical protein